MLAPHSGEAAGYWLQLLMAGMLATLGLALNSTAVVIGAMLIAPLMRPIVELAMGLATGSGPLAFRAGTRAIASIVAVVGGAAVIAWLLPFHEITAELSARTAPSMLDLFVAAACAFVGAYATMFAAGDMATTAAGTSIGISLVPPLCTLGYGIAIRDYDMATGAGLLFTANITGILVVAGLVFVLVGFGQTSSRDLEKEGQAADLASRLGRGWSRRSRRLGAISRLLLPILLLAAVFLPLRRALSDIATRSTIRNQLERMLTDGKVRVAQSSIEFDRSGTIIRVVIVGDASAAKSLEERLTKTLATLGDESPRVTVWAVPDASSLGALARRLDELPPPKIDEVPRAMSERPVRDIELAVAAVWPKSDVGELVHVWVASGSTPRIRVVHLGPPLGSAGLELLSSALGSTEKLAIEEVAFAPDEAAPADATRWLPTALAQIDRAASYELWACVTAPAPPEIPKVRGKPTVVESPSIAEVRKLLEMYTSGRPRVALAISDRWSIAIRRTACADASPPPQGPPSPP